MRSGTCSGFRIAETMKRCVAIRDATAPTTAPTAAQIRAEMETVGGKLDTTLKTAKKVGIQTL
jgi:hypothetical protein